MSPRLKLIVVSAVIVVAPFSLRAANRLALAEVPGPGYLPSLEIRRLREPFDPTFLNALRAAPPTLVFIGDSMLGTRMNPSYLMELSHKKEFVQMVMAPASGPSWWFLAFKNWVVASGVKPRCTFIFFRDTNLTDTMFRLENLYGSELDRAAHDVEPELDRLVLARSRGVWARVYAGINRAYEPDLARMWMEPRIRDWFTRARYRSPKAQLDFDLRLETFFDITRLRKDVAADIGAVEDADFKRELAASILPDLLRLSREHGLPLCFVRVQRRPVNNRPPPESPALRRYVADLRAWLESNGAAFHDDTGDPEMTLDLYGDGDHIANNLRYTEIFRRRFDPLFR